MNQHTMRLWIVAALPALAIGLSACTEKPQGTTVRKADTPAFQGAADAYVAAGWKVGDAASWDQQMTNRAQAQNEYTRIGASAR